MKIEKTTVGSSTRKLSAKYTIDYSQEVEHVISDQLQKEIDNEVINTMIGPTLRETGWYFVQVKTVHWQDIPHDWVKTSIQGEYKCFGNYWYFREHGDAVLFTLKWG
jgi:hypothetical protein